MVEKQKQDNEHIETQFDTTGLFKISSLEQAEVMAQIDSDWEQWKKKLFDTVQYKELIRYCPAFLMSKRLEELMAIYCPKQHKHRHPYDTYMACYVLAINEAKKDLVGENGWVLPRWYDVIYNLRFVMPNLYYANLAAKDVSESWHIGR